jgi:hypothetical protein
MRNGVKIILYDLRVVREPRPRLATNKVSGRSYAKEKNSRRSLQL